MKIFTTGFLMGVGLIAWRMAWINPLWCLFIAAVIVLMYWRLPWCGLLLLLGMALGAAWMAWHVDLQLQQQLPEEWLGKAVLVKGRIVSIPSYRWESWDFDFASSSVANVKINRIFRLNLKDAGAKHRPTKIPADEPQLGDQWQLLVKLKSPVNKVNHEGFNYGEWLFAHHISATGHVLSNASNQLLSRSRWYQPVDQIRHYLWGKMHQSLQGQALTDLLIALTIGDRSEMTSSQWEVLQRTGTAHLMAIAGLHIGLVAGMVFFLVCLLWRLSERLMLWMPNTIAAAIAAWCAALGYSALAGFALPTQRAMIMLSCFSVALIFRRVLAPWQAYFTALFLVLLLEPFEVFGISFWMSFIVVGLIIFALKRGGKRNKWYELIRLQFIVALAVTPLSLYFFHQAAWLSPFLNAVAIPWVGFVVIPLSLFACLFVVFLPGLSHELWWLALKNLQWVWHFLAYFSSLRWVVWQHHISFGLFLLLLVLVVAALSAGRFLGM